MTEPYKLYNSNIPINVQTTTGTTPIADLTEGEYVYGLHDVHRVLEVVDSINEDIYQITYTDGRSDYYRQAEQILDHDNIITVNDLIQMDSSKCGFIQKCIDYGPMRPPPVDPEIGGILLIYGDTDDPLINLPYISKDTADIFYRYNLIPIQIGPLIYFKQHGADEYISWKDFFGDITLIQSEIPQVYSRSSIINRWKFIRGVFDYGKIPDYSFVRIGHYLIDNLRSVQKILWSLGIFSKITYSPYLNMSSTNYFSYDVLYRTIKFQWSLDITDSYLDEKYFFYDENHISSLLNTEYILEMRNDQMLYIKEIKKHSFGYSKSLVLNEPNTPFLTNNFLPRISI